MQYPSFVENTSFYNMDHSKSSEEQLIGLSENIKKVHRLTTSVYNSFEELIESYLQAGTEIFQMQTGIVSNITDDKDYIVKAVVTNLDVINKGDVFELEGTYCREVAKTSQTICFPHVGKIEELQHHPVYENLKLEAYISAPIFVRDVLYGTLNFTSLNPRLYGFSQQEHDLISMMAQAIGTFILLQEKEESLKKLNFRMKELVGHVAHDLRNPVGAILSLSDMMLKLDLGAEKTQLMLQGINEEAKRSLELVNTILDESALGTGKITMHKSDFDYGPLLNKTIQTLNPLIEKRHISLDLKLDDKQNIYGDEKRIQQLFSNLLVNAIKYSKNDATITFKTEPIDDALRFTISNTKGDEKTDFDSSLYKSIGYGLDIVKEVLKQHESELCVLDDELYAVSFELPSVKPV